MIASFLIAFHSFRIDNVCQTIRFLERNHPDVVANSELLLLCQDRMGSIPSRFAETQTISLKLPNMQKCRAINHGARIAKADRLVVLDSDRILPPGYFKEVLSALRPKTVVSTSVTHKLWWMVPDADIIENRLTYKVEKRYTDGGYGMTVFSGNATLFKEDYWRAGGMDEDYIGYGFEDSDMSNRLKRAGVSSIFRDEIEIHLFHRRDSYGYEDQKKLFLDNGLRFCRKWKQAPPPQLLRELNDYTKDMI